MKPKDKTTSIDQATTLVDRLAKENEVLQDASEEMLRVAAAGDGKLTAAQRGVLLNGLGWDDHKIDYEISRMREVLRLKKSAGTRFEMAQAAKARAAAQKREREEMPALERELTKIQRQIEGLKRISVIASRDVEDRKSSKETLHRYLPVWISRRHTELQAEVNNRTGARIRELRLEINMIDSLSTVVGQGRVLHFEALRRSAPHDEYPIEQYSNGRPYETGIGLVLEEIWESYMEKRSQSLPKLKGELASLERENDLALEAADRMLDFYIDD